MNYLRRFWICLFVAFVFMRLSLAEYWGDKNRFWVQWQRADLVGIVAVLLVVAAMLFALYLIVGRCGRAGRLVRDLAFVGITLFYLKIAVMEVAFAKGGIPSAFSWCMNLVVLVATLAVIFRRERVVNIVDGMCLIMSPIVPLYLAALLLAHPIPLFYEDGGGPAGDDDDESVVASGKAPDRVLMFVFDAMSYAHLFKDGELLSDFPNLARMANDSFVFHRAYSTGNGTDAAVPGMLCGVTGSAEISGGIASLNVGGKTIAVRDMTSMFQDMKARGYATYILGSALPYPAFFDDDVDMWKQRRRPVSPHRRAWHTGSSLLSRHVEKRLGIVLPLGVAMSPDARRDSHVSAQTWLHSAVLVHIAGNGRSFSYAHYQVPHYPLMYDKDGPIPRDQIVWDATWDRERYTGNLRYVDSLVGELLDAVQSTKSRTVLIITSDHGVRSDHSLTSPDLRDDQADYQYCHIPLLIHLPGQDKRIDIPNPFPMSMFRQTIIEYVDGDLDMAEFEIWCNSFKQSDIKCAIDMSRIF